MKALLYTADPDVINQLNNLSEDLELRSSVTIQEWEETPLILVGIDKAVPVDGTDLRRAGLILVTAKTDDTLWDAAIALGAEHVCVLPDALPWLRDRLGVAPLALESSALRREVMHDTSLFTEVNEDEDEAYVSLQTHQPGCGHAQQIFELTIEQALALAEALEASAADASLAIEQMRRRNRRNA